MRTSPVEACPVPLSYVLLFPETKLPPWLPCSVRGMETETWFYLLFYSAISYLSIKV